MSKPPVLLPLYQEYLEIHPDFSEKLNLLPNSAAQSILNKLKKEKNEANFLSTLSEINYGLYLHSLGFSVEYGKCLNGQTPDWYFQHDSTKYLVEIRRINGALFNVVINRLYRYLNRKFVEYKGICCIRVSSDLLPSIFLGSDEEKILNAFISQIENQIAEISDFFSAQIANQMLVIHLLFENIAVVRLSIKKLSIEKKQRRDLIWQYGPDSLSWQITKVGSIISEKALRYKNLTENSGLKFYIGLDIVMDTAVTPEEIFSEMVGTSCEYRGKDYKCNSTMLGKFFTDSELEHVDGLLIRYNGSYVRISNPRRERLLEGYFTEVIEGK